LRTFTCESPRDKAGKSADPGSNPGRGTNFFQTKIITKINSITTHAHSY